MNLNTQKACSLVGGGFFLVVTFIEILLFGSLFDGFIGHWGRILAVGTTVFVFNLFLWFFAIKYDQACNTLNTQTEENNEQHTE